MNDRHRAHGVVPGLLLVGLGGFFLLREFGWIPSEIRLLDLWPFLVVVFGLKALLHARSFFGGLFALSFLGLGAALLAGNLGLLTFPILRLWPVLIILLGLAVLFGGRSKRGAPGGGPHGGGGWKKGKSPPGPGDHAHHESFVSDETSLNKQITLSGAEIKIESDAWRGGHLGVTAGGVEIDLRYATLAEDGAKLDLQVMMGGVDIRVPHHWQVFCDVTPLLGGVDDETRSPQGASNPPRFRVTGSVVFGGVNIRN